MSERHRSLVAVGRLEHREVAAALGVAIEDAQPPAVAFRRVGLARHEDGLAETITLIGCPGRVLSRGEIVVREAVEPRLADLAIGDGAGHDPTVTVVAHAEALVEAWELAGAV